MKRLLLILPLLCLAAGDEIPGWKVKEGKWFYKNETISNQDTTASSIESKQAIAGDFSIRFELRIKASEEAGAISVLACHDKKSPNAYQFTISLLNDEIYIMRSLVAVKAPGVLGVRSCKIEKSRSVPITCSRRGNTLLFKVDDIELTCKDPNPLRGKLLALHTIGVVAEFSKVKKE